MNIRVPVLGSGAASNPWDSVEIPVEADDFFDAFAQRELDEDAVRQIEPGARFGARPCSRHEIAKIPPQVNHESWRLEPCAPGGAAAR